LLGATLETHAALGSAGAQMRILHARLRMNGAYRFILRIPKAALPRSLSMNNTTSNFADVGEGPEPSDFVNVGCDGARCDGAQIAITLDGDPHAGDWYIVGYYPAAIDPVLAAAIAHRPNTATPIQFGDGALTLSKLSASPPRNQADADSAETAD